MTATLALVRHSAARARALVLVLAGVLGAFQVLLVVAGRRLHETGAFRSIAGLMPPFVRQAFGESLIAFTSFQGIVCFGYFHPIVLAALAGLVIALATEPAAEIEARFVDLVLARPIPRASLVSRTVVLIVLAPTLAVATMVAGTELGLAWLRPPGVPPPATRVIAALALNLWALLLCLGGAALALATASRRRGAAAAVAGVATFALFLLDYLSKFWTPARTISWLSPFHYLNGMEIVMTGGVNASHLGVLLGVATVGVALAYALFARRDV